METLNNTLLVFHIGMHKTGTTWLQNSYFSNNKAYNLLNDTVTPWDDELLKNIIEVSDCDFDPEKIKKILKLRIKENTINIISAERISGHPISGGYDTEILARRISQICSNIKILITTREINSFIKSIYKQMIREGYCGTPHDFLFQNNWKTAKINKDYFFQSEILNTYINIFNSSNVLVLSFEEFKMNKKKYISRIEDFLNIKNRFNEEISSKLVNKSYSNKRMRALRLLNRFRKTEITPFPIINLGSRTVILISKIAAVFFSKEELISLNVLKKYKNSVL